MSDASSGQFNLDFRPPGYWAEVDPARLLLNGIKGTVRRAQVEKSLNDGGQPLPPMGVTAPALEPPLREFWGGIHPSMMGGEFLPDLAENEVEIARVSLESTTGDVMSVRARREEDGRIRYSVVDEYMDQGTYYAPPVAVAEQPLTLAELIDLMDRTVWLDEEGEVMIQEGDRPMVGLVVPHWRHMNDYYPGELEKIVRFAQASSDFYPELGHYYWERGMEWARLQAAEDCEPDEESDESEDSLSPNPHLET